MGDDSNSDGSRSPSIDIEAEDNGNAIVSKTPDLTKYPPSIAYIMGNEMCERYVSSFRHAATNL
jgi:hypothetical protein